MCVQQKKKKTGKSLNIQQHEVDQANCGSSYFGILDGHKNKILKLYHKIIYGKEKYSLYIAEGKSKL